jgi:hypothetical protein
MNNFYSCILLTLSLCIIFIFCKSNSVAEADIKSEKIQIVNYGDTIVGEINYLYKEESQPLILLLQGMGSHDVNNKIELQSWGSQCFFPNAIHDSVFIFKDLSEELTKSGYITCRFNSRTYLDSYNFLKINEITPSVLISDIEKQISEIKSSDFFSNPRIYILAHSQSALLSANLDDSTLNKVDGLILVGMPTIKTSNLIKLQIEYLFENCSDKVNNNFEEINKLYTILDNKKWSKFEPVLGYYKDFWDDIDSLSTTLIKKINNVKINKLLIYGTEDKHVPVYTIDDFTTGLNSHADIVMVNGMNHFLYDLEFRQINKSLLDNIDKFIQN